MQNSELSIQRHTNTHIDTVGVTFRCWRMILLSWNVIDTIGLLLLLFLRFLRFRYLFLVSWLQLNCMRARQWLEDFAKTKEKHIHKRCWFALNRAIIRHRRCFYDALCLEFKLYMLWCHCNCTHKTLTRRIIWFAFYANRQIQFWV